MLGQLLFHQNKIPLNSLILRDPPAVWIHQDTPGQHRDASGRCTDTPDGYTDLAETHG